MSEGRKTGPAERQAELTASTGDTIAGGKTIVPAEEWSIRHDSPPSTIERDYEQRHGLRTWFVKISKDGLRSDLFNLQKILNRGFATNDPLTPVYLGRAIVEIHRHVSPVESLLAQADWRRLVEYMHVAKQCHDRLAPDHLALADDILAACSTYCPTADLAANDQDRIASDFDRVHAGALPSKYPPIGRSHEQQPSPRLGPLRELVSCFETDHRKLSEKTGQEITATMQSITADARPLTDAERTEAAALFGRLKPYSEFETERLVAQSSEQVTSLSVAIREQTRELLQPVIFEAINQALHRSGFLGDFDAWLEALQGLAMLESSSEIVSVFAALTEQIAKSREAAEDCAEYGSQTLKRVAGKKVRENVAIEFADSVMRLVNDGQLDLRSVVNGCEVVINATNDTRYSSGTFSLREINVSSKDRRVRTHSVIPALRLQIRKNPQKPQKGRKRTGYNQ